MKRVILILLLFLFLAPSYAVTKKEKEYKKNISNYDVPRKVRNLSGEEQRAQFWADVVKENHHLKDVLKAIEKNSWFDKEVKKNIKIFNKFEEIKDSLILDDSEYNLTSYIGKLGISPRVCQIYVINDSIVGASTVRYNESLSILLNKGLLSELNGDEDLILAVVSHQFAHGLLLHLYTSEYNRLAKVIENPSGSSVAAIAAGTLFGALGGALVGGIAGGISGEMAKKKAMKKFEIIRANMNAMSYPELLNTTSYDMNCEMEADLAAYRFMDQIYGKGDKYIELLEIMRKNGVQKRTGSLKASEVFERKNLIEYAVEHPEIANKKK